MTRSESLYARLTADSGITNIVGDRIFPLLSQPRDGETVCTYKFLVTYDYSISGGFVGIATLEIRCWSSDYDDAHELSDAIIANLQNFKGELGGAGGIYVLHSLIQQEEDSYIDIKPDVGVFEAFSRYEIMYRI